MTQTTSPANPDSSASDDTQLGIVVVCVVVGGMLILGGVAITLYVFLKKRNDEIQYAPIQMVSAGNLTLKSRCLFLS